MIHSGRQAARKVAQTAWRNFGTQAFRVDPEGQFWTPLKTAERYGWVTFWDKDKCAVTAAGVAELEPWRMQEPKPAVTCPTCQMERRP
jgi:hypothetical protein